MGSSSYKHTKILMGMPVTVMIVGARVPRRIFGEVYGLFAEVDNRFSTYKPDSEVSRVNRGLPERQWSDEMKLVQQLCEQTKRQTDGYFDAHHQGKFDPSGLVKGWAVKQAADMLVARGFENFYIDAGGDIQAHGLNAAGEPWRIGIRNPFNRAEIIKVLAIRNEGVATSGAYIRGQHIYDPHAPSLPPSSFASVTIIGPDIYEADRFATAVYAMGSKGAAFVESRPDCEAYLIGSDGVATITSGFERYTYA